MSKPTYTIPKTKGYRAARRSQRQAEATQRLASYNNFVDDLLTKSSPSVAAEYFDTLSRSQQHRVVASGVYRYTENSTIESAKRGSA